MFNNVRLKFKQYFLHSRKEIRFYRKTGFGEGGLSFFKNLLAAYWLDLEGTLTRGMRYEME